MTDKTEQQKQWAKIVAKAWADEEYKEKLMSDPAAVMKAEGVEVPEGVDVKCVEATDTQAWIVLPRKPESNIEEMTERLTALVRVTLDYCPCI